jgi:hypothetical protein
MTGSPWPRLRRYATPLLGRDRRRRVAVRLARIGPADVAEDALEIAAGVASGSGRLWLAFKAIRSFAEAVPDSTLTPAARRARRLATLYAGRAFFDADAGWLDVPRVPELLGSLLPELLARTGLPALDGPEPSGGAGERVDARPGQIRRQGAWASTVAAPDDPTDTEAAPAPAAQGSRDVARDAASGPRIAADWTGPRVCPLLEPIAAEGPEGKIVRRAWQALEADLPLRGTADPDLDRLADEAPWLSPAIDRLRRMLALQRLSGRSWFRAKPILLVGPAGTGKTRLARRIAELAGVPMRTVPCGASTDARMLLGTARGWHSAQPCFPLVAMARSGCANPVIYVDELDKGARSSPNGSVSAGLLAFLEPETAARWTDECLLARADLTTVTWIASANELAPIPAALRSRFSIIEVPAPPASAFDGALR